MTKMERKQKVILCVATYCRLYGRTPSTSWLYDALGDDYCDEIAEYLKSGDNYFQIAA